MPGRSPSALPSRVRNWGGSPRDEVRRSSVKGPKVAIRRDGTWICVGTIICSVMSDTTPFLHYFSRAALQTFLSLACSISRDSLPLAAHCFSVSVRRAEQASSSHLPRTKLDIVIITSTCYGISTPCYAIDSSSLQLQAERCHTKTLETKQKLSKEHIRKHRILLQEENIGIRGCDIFVNYRLVFNNLWQWYAEGFVRPAPQ